MKVSVVITAHGEGKDLPGILNSLEMQRECIEVPHSRTGKPVKWGLGERCATELEVIICWDGEVGRHEPWDERGLHVVQVPCPKEGGVGHHTRAPGIEAATGDWIVCTNSDNVFVHGWLSRVTFGIRFGRVGIVYYSIVSNLWGYMTGPRPQLKKGYVDLSSVVVRADIAKQVGFPFRDYDGDGDYIEQCAAIARKAKLNAVYLPYVLAIHN